MFKYLPGMESGIGAAIHHMMKEHGEPDGDEGDTTINLNIGEKESDMNDIAGLMALMQNNKGMDLPGILALCQQKGYGDGKGGWGGDGMGLLVILLFFLMFNNGGWGNGANRAAAEGLVGADNCQRIIGLHDRISAAQAASTQGFFQLDTKLCSSIAETIAAVRNQGDRNYDATRNVGDAVRDCCCKVEAQLATVLCEIRGVQRDIRETAGLTNAKIELEALKAENARQAMECRLVQAQKDCCCEMNQRFDKLDCKLDNMCKDQEIARLSRELAAERASNLAEETAERSVRRLERFITDHYTPNAAAQRA